MENEGNWVIYSQGWGFTYEVVYDLLSYSLFTKYKDLKCKIIAMTCRALLAEMK